MKKKVTDGLTIGEAHVPTLATRDTSLDIFKSFRPLHEFENIFFLMLDKPRAALIFVL